MRDGARLLATVIGPSSLHELDLTANRIDAGMFIELCCVIGLHKLLLKNLSATFNCHLYFFQKKALTL